MSIILSTNLILGDVQPGLSADHPIIGWHNVVEAGSVVADTETDGFPASNVANPATYLDWRAEFSTGDQYLTFTISYVDEIDYVGIAGHNRPLFAELRRKELSSALNNHARLLTWMAPPSAG